jgi:xylose isomerase
MDRTDLFHGHIGGIDTLAQSLLVAADLLESRVLENARDTRYSGWSSKAGQDILNGKATLAKLADKATTGGVDPAPVSGRQELLENHVNHAIWSAR